MTDGNGSVRRKSVSCHGIVIRNRLDITETSYERQCVPDHLPFECLLNNLFGLTSKFRVTGPLLVESTGDRWIPLTRGSNAENVSISWRHQRYALLPSLNCPPQRTLCPGGYCWDYNLSSLLLTHCSKDKMSAILQTIFSNVFFDWKLIHFD